MKFILVTLLAVSSIQASQLRQVIDLNFSVKTNMAGFSFVGKLSEEKTIDQGNTQKLQINPQDLTTEMSLRDEHMREQIFKNKPIIFEGKKDCTQKCILKGKLTISQTTKEVEIPLTQEGDHLFKLTHTISLNAFGITKPEFMGVKVEDNVKVTATLK